MNINIEEKLKEDFFQESKYISDGDSCDNHAMTHEDTEILGMFCDVTSIRGEDLKDVLIKGYLKRMVDIETQELIKKATPTNYFQVGVDGRMFSWFMYADLTTDGKYTADQIFIDHGLHVKFDREYTKTVDGDTYSVILCRIRKKKKDIFIQCMDELNKKILICGHNSYEKIREDMGMIAYESIECCV